MAEEKQVELKMDPAGMYTDKTYSDRKAGSIRVLTPVTQDGKADSSREVVFEGHAQLSTPMGTFPLVFEMSVKSLPEAIDGFSAACQAAAEDAIKQLEQMQMQRDAENSRIITPDSGKV